MATLEGSTVFVSGGSRGIGLAIAKRVAQEGANVVIAAKTAEPSEKLPGTIYTAAAAIERAGAAKGSKALPLVCDIRDEAAVRAAVDAAVARFGGIDVLVNNASAISLTGTLATPMKRFDLMFDVNVRGTFLCSQACLPHLERSAAAGRSPHILTLAPPLNLDPKWFRNHVAYTIAKYGMSMCVLGMAEEFRAAGVGVNALWPRTVIATSALALIPGVASQLDMTRKPEIMADAACLVLASDPGMTTGRFLIDEEVLRAAGVTDFERYAVAPGTPLFPDLFVEG
jgi:citronellol/citronellal dehydrogenase